MEEGTTESCGGCIAVAIVAALTLKFFGPIGLAIVVIAFLGSHHRTT